MSDCVATFHYVKCDYPGCGNTTIVNDDSGNDVYGDSRENSLEISDNYGEPFAVINRKDYCPKHYDEDDDGKLFIKD